MGIYYKGKFSEEALKAPGGTIKTITKRLYLIFIILYPKFSEQEQIGSFFEKLDKLITLHQQEPFLSGNSVNGGGKLCSQ